MEKIKIAGISGSFKDTSINSGLLRKAIELMPDDMEADIVNYRDVPLFDPDEQAKGFPKIVTEIAVRIRNSDAVLFATPEYNFSIPGSLKNLIDWISRFRGTNYPLWKKPIGIIGASTGVSGTIRAQLHLRQIAVELDTYPMAKPEIVLPRAGDKFDKDGNLTDEKTMEYLKKYMEEFKTHILRFRKEV
jgi:chromate reductase